jgi:hypothetical protein
MKIAFDFDGTITKNPTLFKVLIESLQSSHHDVYLISGTSEEKRAELLSELRDYGISFSSHSIILKPIAGNIHEVTQWKYDVIDKLKIRCFFENRRETAKKINELCTTFLIQ